MYKIIAITIGILVLASCSKDHSEIRMNFQAEAVEIISYSPISNVEVSAYNGGYPNVQVLGSGTSDSQGLLSMQIIGYKDQSFMLDVDAPEGYEFVSILNNNGNAISLPLKLNVDQGTVTLVLIPPAWVKLNMNTNAGTAQFDYVCVSGRHNYTIIPASDVWRDQVLPIRGNVPDTIGVELFTIKYRETVYGLERNDSLVKKHSIITAGISKDTINIDVSL